MEPLICDGLMPVHCIESSRTWVTGSSVTVTARLSSALTHAVTIPLRLTAGSAERDDYGRLESITIASGETSGSGAISTSADADTDDETFTVALRNLPSSVTAGRPRSVEITITEAIPTPALPVGGALLLGLLLAWRGAVRVRRRRRVAGVMSNTRGLAAEPAEPAARPAAGEEA